MLLERTYSSRRLRSTDCYVKMEGVDLSLEVLVLGEIGREVSAWCLQ